MKRTRFVFWYILSGLSGAFLASSSTLAQEKKALPIAQSEAPVGSYAHFRQVDSPFAPTNRVCLFTLRLETNGTYSAECGEKQVIQDGDIFRLRPVVARGTWQWEAQNQEFQLEPGDFTFYIKRLPVDKHNPNHLVWGSSFLERQESK
ncbi:MAG TPA: hypothetical protein VN578_13520 [Candidatus Binatia bacterium]|nr:hypothetical protein [Candidatus Binatia bacterium]